MKDISQRRDRVAEKGRKLGHSLFTERFQDPRVVVFVCR